MRLRRLKKRQADDLVRLLIALGSASAERRFARPLERPRASLGRS
jgi:hypothetical protein